MIIPRRQLHFWGERDAVFVSMTVLPVYHPANSGANIKPKKQRGGRAVFTLIILVKLV